MSEPYEEFIAQTRAVTEKFLAHYIADHPQQFKPVTDAYCQGFREANEMMCAVLLAHWNAEDRRTSHQ